MKTLFQTLSVPLVLVGFALLPTISPASETRVDSTGGLTTLLDDETDNLSLFLDGNPAGLVLLNTRDRLDVSGELSYLDQEGPWGSNRQLVLTTIPRYTDNPIKYEGLMLFPDPHWAVQVLGDFFLDQGVSVAGFTGDALPPSDTNTQRQYRGLIRVSYAFPFGAAGLEVLNSQKDSRDDPGLWNPDVGLSSGASGQNQTLVKTGIITTFPANLSPESPRWQAGGWFTAQLGPDSENQILNLYYSGSPSFPLTQIIATSDYWEWDAELLYELPSIAKIRLSADMATSSTDLTQTVPFTSPDFDQLSLGPYRYSQFQSFTLACAFKCSLPVSEEENFKVGGNLTGYFLSLDLLNPDGSVDSGQGNQKIGTQLGIGLDSPKDYTMGLQWKSVSRLNGNDSINNPGIALGVPAGGDLYQLAFGGEKWLAVTWAFRMGLVLEEDVDGQTSQKNFSTTINAGIGLEKAFGRADIRFFLGQTSDLNDSANTVGVTGAQLATTVFL
ncbi:MAG TPA: hypothetical protein VK859_06925 [bacterium]|nr:hypothetical protein [bacterium]